MVDLAEPKLGEKGIDLGSGDGRIVIAFATKGVEMLGLELDEQLARKSREIIKNENLTHARIEEKDLWDVDLSLFDIICIYPMPDIMQDLEKKLAKETKPGARILTNYYPLPTWSAKSTKYHIFLYQR